VPVQVPHHHQLCVLSCPGGGGGGLGVFRTSSLLLALRSLQPWNTIPFIDSMPTGFVFTSCQHAYTS